MSHFGRNNTFHTVIDDDTVNYVAFQFRYCQREFIDRIVIMSGGFTSDDSELEGAEFVTVLLFVPLRFRVHGGGGGNGLGETIAETV